MLFSETKTILFSLLLLFAALFFLPKNSNATDYSSGSFTVKDPVIDTGSDSSTSANFGLGQSLSQIAIGKSTSTNFQLWSGFQYYFKVNANVLTATPGDSEVDLSWTVPATFLGASVASYEVGTGTTSGSYVFQNVGNVISFTKSGLTNGTPYFFIIKSLAAGGTVLVYSNEATATPTAAVTPPPPPPGGGGGGPAYTGSISITGTAYPTSLVTILRDSVITGTVTADASGNFTFNQSGISAGTYSYGVYATDPNGVKSPTVGFSKTISTGITESMTGVIVAPTISQSHVSIKKGETITISGYAAPNSPLTLNYSGPANFVQNVTSSSQGYYSYALNTTSYAKGNYAVYSYYKVGAIKSPNSFTLNFTIGDSTVTPPTGTCKRSDLNCDGKVDLIDFSILLYFWDRTDFSKNPRADIDKNGEIGLRDLSIMLYDWTG